MKWVVFKYLNDEIVYSILINVENFIRDKIEIVIER